MKHRVAILIPYFGDWPEWINFFIESCRANSSIDWFLFTDREPPANSARNVRYQRIAFEDYKELLSSALGVRIAAEQPYKLCDVRPALPFVHRTLVAGYDFVGFGDLDVIYGDIRSFYDDDLLASCDLLSSHPDRVSGHLCLFRNSEKMVTAFKRVPGWASLMETPKNVTFDERAFYNLFRGPWAKVSSALHIRKPRCFFRESYSTPAPTEHMRWFWENGRLTNEYYPHHPLMYLHFMSWHSSRWYADQPNTAPAAGAPWSRLPDVVQMDWREARKDGFMISPDGIQPIARRHYE